MLSANAIAALEAGKKIEAIKIVRQEQGIGLKEAKELVESYTAERPELAEKSSGNVSVLTMAAMVIVVFCVYKYFAG